MRHPAPTSLNVNHFPTTLHEGTATHLFPRIIQIAFVLFASSGAPGGTRTPDLLVS